MAGAAATMVGYQNASLYKIDHPCRVSLPANVKGGSYPLQHLYGHFGLVRMCRLGHNVPWVKA